MPLLVIGALAKTYLILTSQYEVGTLSELMGGGCG